MELPGENTLCRGSGSRMGPRRRQSDFLLPLAMSFAKLTPLAARMLTTLLTSNAVDVLLDASRYASGSRGPDDAQLAERRWRRFLTMKSRAY